MSQPPNYDAAGVREEAMWRTLTANDVKTVMRIAGVVDIIATLFLLVFVLAGSVPPFPPAILEYASIYHATHIYAGALALAVSGSRSFEAFGLVAALGILSLLLDLWALITLLIWFIGCLSGSPITFVADCVLSTLTRFTIFVLAIVLFVTTCVIFSKALTMINYIRHMRTGNEIARNVGKEYKAQ